VTRHSKVSAIAAAAVLVVGLGAGCAKQAAPNGASADAPKVDLKIVAQIPIDQDGKEVKPEGGGSPATAGGDGNASCPQLAIAMAGPLTGPDTPFG